MRSIIISALIFGALGMTCGCGSVSVTRREPDRASIELQHSKLDLTRGVSREDAVIIAQHYMLSKGYDNDWFVAAPKKVSDDSKENTWTVEFEPKEDGYGSGPRPKSEFTLQMLMPYWVTVHKDTGKISVVAFRSKQK